MSDLISRAELFNRLATVQTLGEAYGVIQGMPTAEDDFYWELLEEQHNHDVVIGGVVKGENEDDSGRR